MEHVCQHEGCQNGAALPEGDIEAAKAIAEVMECTAIDAPDGIQFFCKAHRNHALHRMRKLGLLDPPKPPEPPQLAPEAEITEAHLPRVEGAATPLPQVAASALIVVCQKGKLLGVFDGADQADGIRDMAKSLSSEEVFSITVELNKPGSYPMEIEIKEDSTPFRCTKCHKPVPVDRMECEHCSKKGAPNAVQKEGRKKRKRNEPQPSQKEG